MACFTQNWCLTNLHNHRLSDNIIFKSFISERMSQVAKTGLFPLAGWQPDAELRPLDAAPLCDHPHCCDGLPLVAITSRPQEPELTHVEAKI